eukprot:375414_1
MLVFYPHLSCERYPNMHIFVRGSTRAFSIHSLLLSSFLRAKAMLLVRSRLFAAEVEARRRDIDARRVAAMGSGERSDRVRTYNFPQDRVTDHRCNETRHNVKAMLRCDTEAVTLKGFIAALRKADMSQKVERLLLQDGIS